MESLEWASARPSGEIVMEGRWNESSPGACGGNLSRGADEWASPRPSSHPFSLFLSTRQAERRLWKGDGMRDPAHTLAAEKRRRGGSVDCGWGRGGEAGSEGRGLGGRRTWMKRGRERERERSRDPIHARGPRRRWTSGWGALCCSGRWAPVPEALVTRADEASSVRGEGSCAGCHSHQLESRNLSDSAAAPEPAPSR